MTFKDLKQKLAKLQGNTNTSLDILKNKPFWIWDKQEHLAKARESNQQCCANHIWGCPVKAGKERPLWDYQKLIIDTLMLQEGSFKDKHLYLLKAGGIGASETFLRIMAWLCTKDNTYSNSQMVIVTGPNWDLSIKLMKRLKQLFEPKLNIIFQDKETVCNLNGCVIESFPSNHLDSFRSLTNPAFVFCDELDFIRKSEQIDIRHICERYIPKSDPFIVLCSTPNAPGSIMESIKKEPEDTCLYRRLYIDWTYGLNKIFSPEEIAKAKMSPSWEREFCLKFSGKIGNLLSPLKIDAAIQEGEQLSKIPVNPYSLISCGVDPAFGSSAFGIVLVEHIREENKLRVIYEGNFDNHPDPQDMIDLIFEFKRKYPNLKVFCDSANRGFITSLKISLNENIHYERVEDVLPGQNICIPVNFSQQHKQMISHLAALFNDNYIGVEQRFEKLILSLKTAVVNEYSLDKDSTSYNDIFDGLRLSLRAFKIN